MQIDLTGKVALITGASKGLGKAMAHRFASSGADIAIMARNLDALNATAHAIAADTGRIVRGYVCDVSRAAELEKAFDAVQEDFPVIDILVNNAGSSARSPVASLTHDMLFADIDLKISPALRLAQRVLPGMREQRWGRILNVVNIGAKAPQPGSAPTSMTRAAGIAMTKVMAHEFAKHNILVNALCVGRIRSEQWARNHLRDHPEVSFEEYLRERAADIPLGRMGEPQEFAQIACFLASDLASYITGTAINVDGGASPVV